MNFFTEITYPCYIGEIPKSSVVNKEIIDSFVTFSYDTGTLRYLYDAIPSTNYENNDYNLDYSERIQTVRAIANFNRFLDITDLPMDKVYSTVELKDYIEKSMNSVSEGYLIISSVAEFDFENDKSFMLFEIKK